MSEATVIEGFGPGDEAELHSAAGLQHADVQSLSTIVGRRRNQGDPRPLHGSSTNSWPSSLGVRCSRKIASSSSWSIHQPM